jgi:hypothetical protein
LEASLDHLWVTPPSHFTPQKVRGFVVGFTWQRERKTIIKKILLISRSVKGKISSPNCSIFPAKIADFGLNYRILKVKAKNNISGSTSHSREKIAPSPQI